MSNFKLGTYAVNKVAAALSTVNVTKYKHSTPLTNRPDEFIVINSRPLRTGILQIVAVNVNYHIKNLAGGVPNISKLESVPQAILDILEQYNGVIYTDYDGNEIISEPQFDSHYSNLIFKVKIIN